MGEPQIPRHGRFGATPHHMAHISGRSTTKLKLQPRKNQNLANKKAPNSGACFVSNHLCFPCFHYFLLFPVVSVIFCVVWRGAVRKLLFGSFCCVWLLILRFCCSRQFSLFSEFFYSVDGQGASCHKPTTSLSPLTASEDSAPNYQAELGLLGKQEEIL